MINFGELAREKRLEKKYTLREFCKRIDVDPSNWSKVEKGLVKPPQKRSIYLSIAFFLDIDINKLRALYFIARGEIPVNISCDPGLLKKQYKLILKSLK